jgi:hypothetical protein
MMSWHDALIACALLRDAARDAEQAIQALQVVRVGQLLESWEAQRGLVHVCHRFLDKVVGA